MNWLVENFSLSCQLHRADIIFYIENNGVISTLTTENLRLKVDQGTRSEEKYQFNLASVLIEKEIFAFQPETETGIVDPNENALGYKPDDFERGLFYIKSTVGQKYVDGDKKAAMSSLPYEASQKKYMFEIQYKGKRDFNGQSNDFFQLISIYDNNPVDLFSNGSPSYFYIKKVNPDIEFEGYKDLYVSMKSNNKFYDCCKSMYSDSDEYKVCVFSGHYYAEDDNSYSPKCKQKMDVFCATNLADNTCINYCNLGKGTNCDMIAGNYCNNKSLTDKTCYCFWPENKMTEYYNSLHHAFPNLDISQQVECSHALCSRQDPLTIKRKRMKSGDNTCPPIKLCVQSLSINAGVIDIANLTVNQKINCGNSPTSPSSGSNGLTDISDDNISDDNVDSKTVTDNQYYIIGGKSIKKTTLLISSILFFLCFFIIICMIVLLVL